MDRSYFIQDVELGYHSGCPVEEPGNFFIIARRLTDSGDIELLCPRNKTYIHFSVANYSFGSSRIIGQKLRLLYSKRIIDAYHSDFT